MAQLPIDQTLRLAIQHHHGGRLGQAEQLYCHILARQPNHADALHLLGVVAYQLGQHDIAVDLIREAIAVKPGFPQAEVNLGNALRDKGQSDEAIAAYRRAIVLQPNVPEAHNNLGSALQDKGQLDEAIAAYRLATALRPEYSDAYINLGSALQANGQAEEAVAACRQAIALNPDSPQAHFYLGNALQALEQLDEAIAAYRRAIALKPDFAEAFSNLGSVLQDAGKPDDAIAAHREAIALDPNLAKAHSNLGNALQENGQPDEAIVACRRAIALDPNLAMAYGNLGGALVDKGEPDEAIAAFRQAIRLKPDDPGAHWYLAITLLSTGRFAEGWEEFEWRLKDKSKGLGRDFARPQWGGEPLDGKTLLLHAEGGYGDALQFIRYTRLLPPGNRKVVLECQPALARLFAGLAGVDEVVVRGQSLPAFDYHVPLQGLPRLFTTDLANIPNAVPYLKSPPDGRSHWSERARGDGRLKVGLAWAGSSAGSAVSDRRTRGLDIFAPLGRLRGVRWFSLQKGPESGVDGQAGLELTDFTSELHDFADTAGLIEALDLVISVDTSVAHLAGALARPVWVLIPSSPDFRWLRDRTDSPWYPTMRLFRQLRLGDWNGVIEQLNRALEALATHDA